MLKKLQRNLLLPQAQHSPWSRRSFGWTTPAKHSEFSLASPWGQTSELIGITDEKNTLHSCEAMEQNESQGENTEAWSRKNILGPPILPSSHPHLEMEMFWDLILAWIMILQTHSIWWFLLGSCSFITLQALGCSKCENIFWVLPKRM